jgi:hypothetical protein
MEVMTVILLGYAFLIGWAIAEEEYNTAAWMFGIGVVFLILSTTVIISTPNGFAIFG